MRIEIRHVRNGAILRVEPEQEGEEYVCQETESEEIEAFGGHLQTGQ